MRSSLASSVATATSEPMYEVTEPTVIAEGLTIPWALTWLPTGEILVTERPGTLRRIGRDQKVHTISGVLHRGEGGLLGLALHPNFAKNGWLYLYLTTNDGGKVTNRVERYVYANDTLTDRTDIITGIPGANNHDGGALSFGPDGKLFVTTGDASAESNAQDTKSLAGKILRVNDDGSIPSDNPFGTAVYSYGHRNPQGLAWDSQGNLWATEHGRSGVLSGYDELNKIEKGKNYGWPNIQGDEMEGEMVIPALHSGANSTWAPASAAFVNGSVFFGGLKGAALYEAVLPTVYGEAPTLKTHLLNKYGRIRAVVVSPDKKTLFITTSNKDGRGSVKAGDDKIIRVDLAWLASN